MAWHLKFRLEKPIEKFINSFFSNSNECLLSSNLGIKNTRLSSVNCSEIKQILE